MAVVRSRQRLGGVSRRHAVHQPRRQRGRLEIDGNVRHDIFGNMYWAFNIHEKFDSDPPDDRPRSDLGLSFSLGWTF
jgi:hypothetical protein